MIHFSFEGSFLALSTFGRQVNTSVGPFAEMCEYSAFDSSSPVIWLLPDIFREGIRACRLQMGFCGRDSCVTGAINRPRSWPVMLLHFEAACQRRPSTALLDCCSQHGGAVWRVRMLVLCVDRLFIEFSEQMDDILSGVAYRKSQLEYLESFVPLGLPPREFLNPICVFS